MRDMNFLHKVAPKWYQKKGILVTVFLSLFILSLVGVYGVRLPVMQRNVKRQILFDLISTREWCYTLKEGYDELQNDNRLLLDSLDTINGIELNIPVNWIDRLEIIEKLTPSSVHIQSFTYDNLVIAITGTCSTDREVAEFISKLGDDDLFREISIDKLTYTGDMVSFQIFCTLL